MVELQGKLLGTYHKLRRGRLMHIAVWIVILLISLFIFSFAASDDGLFGGSGFGIFLGVFSAITVLFAGVSIIVNVLGILLSTDLYLDIYEDGFKVRRTGMGLMMWRNGEETYHWNTLATWRIDTKSFHDALGYAGAPDPISGLIVKLLIGIFTQVSDDIEYALTISFSMVDGKKLGFTSLRGDNFQQLTDEILPELLKHKRRLR